LIEECSEVIKAGTKILRHGYKSFDPTNPQHKGNKIDLQTELADVFTAVGLMIQMGDIDLAFLENNTKGKELKFGKHIPIDKKYLRHQK